jgi:hypothetical protein
MTNKEWRECANPQWMIEALEKEPYYYSPTAYRAHYCRRTRLLTVACCRQVWEKMTYISSRQAVEIAERFADGAATPEDMIEAWDRSRDVSAAQHINWAGHVACNGVAVGQRVDCLHALNSLHHGGQPLALQAQLVRDIFGDSVKPHLPYCNDGCRMLTSGRGDRPHHCHTHDKDVVYLHPSAVCPDSLEYLQRSFCTARVQALATAAYTTLCEQECWRCGGSGEVVPGGSGRFDPWELRCDFCGGTGMLGRHCLDPAALAVLADALEEVGCTNADLLRHLRKGGLHVRGCWALDRVLGQA